MGTRKVKHCHVHAGPHWPTLILNLQVIGAGQYGSLVRLSQKEINQALKGVVFLPNSTSVATTTLKPNMIAPRVWCLHTKAHMCCKLGCCYMTRCQSPQMSTPKSIWNDINHKMSRDKFFGTSSIAAMNQEPMIVIPQVHMLPYKSTGTCKLTNDNVIFIGRRS